MRRGTSDGSWSNPRAENWVTHGPRFSRVNPRPKFHGYNQRCSPTGPRHWRPDGNFRPRMPWNAFHRPPNNDNHQGSPSRFTWPETNQNIFPPAMHNPAPAQFPPTPDSYGLKGEQNLHETINTVKQKLRERTMSTDLQTEPAHDNQTDENSYKPGERRRIEHSKTSKSSVSKKTDKRGEGHHSKTKPNNSHSQSLSDICKRKTEIMRRKILKQLFKLDKDKLRNLLNQSESSTKYEVVLNSLFKETRDAINRDIRNAAEKSLQDNCKKSDLNHTKNVVEDEFLGHLGTMLDTDATLELSSMDSQMIAQLSRVLQQDLMGPLNDVISVRSLANAVSDDYCNEFQYQNYTQPEPPYDPQQSDLCGDYNYYRMYGGVKDENCPNLENRFYDDYYEEHNQHGEMKFNPEGDVNSNRSEDFMKRSSCDNEQSVFINNQNSVHNVEQASLCKSPTKKVRNKTYQTNSVNQTITDIPSDDVSHIGAESQTNPFQNINQNPAIKDEDFRTLLPKNINFHDQSFFLTNVEEKEKTPKVPEYKEMPCQQVTNSLGDSTALELPKPYSVPEIIIRKDLFSPQKLYILANSTGQSGTHKPKTSNVSCQSDMLVQMPEKPKLTNASCQSDRLVTTRNQGSQYYTKRCEASTQICESLFASKCKGTQTVRDYFRDKTCQTLRIDGLSSLVLSDDSRSVVNVETQTCNLFPIVKPETKNVEISCNLMDDVKCSKIVEEKVVKSDNVLERMRDIDSQILELTKEKLGLYGLLKSSVLESDFTKKTDLIHNSYHIPIIRNKTKNSNEPSRRIEKRSNSSMKHSLENRHSKSKEKPKESSGSYSGKTIPNNCEPLKGKHAGSVRSEKSQPRTRSRPVTREASHPKHGRHKSAVNKKNNHLTPSDNSVVVQQCNFIPGKDIANAVKAEDQFSDTASIHGNVESRYLDSFGHPVPSECEVVVSEEVVINSENDNNCMLSDDTKNQSGGKKRKRSDTRKSRSSSSSNSRSICDTLVTKTNSNRLPQSGKTVPPIKIRKRVPTLEAESHLKGSPLYNLISQMNTSDEEVDENTKSSVESSKIDPSHTLPYLVDENSTNSNDLKILDCRVRLERLDVSKIPDYLKTSSDSNSFNCFNNPSTSFVEEIEPTILNDDTLFSSKNYEDDDYNMLQSGNFGNFCDTDPEIIENIEVDDIIDQWDSKFFDNVPFLDDREMQDKSLLGGMSYGQNEDVEADEVEEEMTEPTFFSSHEEPIIALQIIKNTFLASSQDGCVYHYDSKNGKLLLKIKVCDVAVTCLSLKRKSTQFYAGSHDGALRCYDYLTGEKVLELPTMCGPIQSMFQEWNTLYIGTQTGFIIQFDIMTSSLLADSTIKFSDNVILALHAMKEGPRKVVLIASRSQEVTVKDAATGLLLRSFHGPNNTVYSLMFDSGKVYCGTSGLNVQIFDFVTGDMVGYFTGGRGAVCLKKYRGLIFTGCYDGVIYIYSKTGNDKPVAKLPGPGKMLLALDIFKNKVVAAFKDKKLVVIPLPKEVIHLFE